MTDKISIDERHYQLADQHIAEMRDEGIISAEMAGDPTFRIGAVHGIALNEQFGDELRAAVRDIMGDMASPYEGDLH